MLLLRLNRSSSSPHFLRTKRNGPSSEARDLDSSVCPGLLSSQAYGPHVGGTGFVPARPAAPALRCTVCAAMQQPTVCFERCFTRQLVEAYLG